MSSRQPQSQLCSLSEAGTNVVLGYVLALVTQRLAYLLFGIETSLARTAPLRRSSPLRRSPAPTWSGGRSSAWREPIMRGRKPTPSHLKLLHGNPGKRPMNPHEPRPENRVPTCPAHLNPSAKAEWKRLAQQLHVLRMIGELDRAALASAGDRRGFLHFQAQPGSASAWRSRS